MPHSFSTYLSLYPHLYWKSWCDKRLILSCSYLRKIFRFKVSHWSSSRKLIHAITLWLADASIHSPTLLPYLLGSKSGAKIRLHPYLWLAGLLHLDLTSGAKIYLLTPGLIMASLPRPKIWIRLLFTKVPLLITGMPLLFTEMPLFILNHLPKQTM